MRRWWSTDWDAWPNPTTVCSTRVRRLFTFTALSQLPCLALDRVFQSINRGPIEKRSRPEIVVYPPSCFLRAFWVSFGNKSTISISSFFAFRQRSSSTWFASTSVCNSMSSSTTEMKYFFTNLTCYLSKTFSVFCLTLPSGSNIGWSPSVKLFVPGWGPVPEASKMADPPSSSSEEPMTSCS